MFNITDSIESSSVNDIGDIQLNQKIKNFEMMDPNIQHAVTQMVQATENHLDDVQNMMKLQNNKMINSYVLHNFIQTQQKNKNWRANMNMIPHFQFF